MVTEVKRTRTISPTVERELWARAAGRCQFSGCNKLLYKSSITQESVNLSQKAHIYSFSEKGPRGWGPFTLKLSRLNDISNLMLVCHGCHEKIDQDEKGIRYTARLLIQWKNDHERRIEIVSGINPDKKSHVVLYGANIGSEKSPIELHSCIDAMFPHYYPASDKPIPLSMVSELKDSSSQYWDSESENLFKSFERKIAPLIEQDECKHFSIFALAPQPLLIKLGALLTDKISVETYQPHREPKGWLWKERPDGFEYEIRRPEKYGGISVLILSLSDHVSRDRISRVLGENTSVWEVTISEPHNNFMQSKQQLLNFMKLMRQLMIEIKLKQGNTDDLHIFPVMPVSCAIELGRIRMPKAEMPWVIYDHNVNLQEFIKALEIRGDLHAEQS